jgi:aminoglycoside phosphotransferase (APT) family kinase protein
VAKLARAEGGVSESRSIDADSIVAAASLALGLVRPEVTPLAAGVVNRSYRLREGPHDFVLRVIGAAAQGLGASSRSELAMQSLAAAAGLAPRIVLVDAARGFVVSEHAAGGAPSAAAMREPALLGRIGAWFACLHALEAPPGLPAIDFGERAAAYLARVAAHGRDPSNRRMQRELSRRCAALSPTARLAPCHHDLHRRNLLDDGTRILALDWEYAGPGDPAADLAACAGYHALDETAIDALFAGYGGTTARFRARVAALAWIFDCLWYGWNAAAGEEGLEPDPGEQSRIAARLLA